MSASADRREKAQERRVTSPEPMAESPAMQNNAGQSMPRPFLRQWWTAIICASATMSAIAILPTGCDFQDSKSEPTSYSVRHTPVPSHKWQPLFEGKKMGFGTPDGETVIDPIFSDITLFRDERACVQLDDSLWRIITSSGDVLNAGPFAEVAVYSEGYLAVGIATDSSTRYTYVDTQGKRLMDPVFVSLPAHWREGYGIGELPSGKDAFVDRSGRIVASFRRAEPFFEGLAAVIPSAGDRHWGFVNSEFELVIPPRFDDVGRFSSGRAPVDVGASVGYIDRAGKLVIPAIHRTALNFIGDIAPVQLEEGWTLIDREGRRVFEIVGSQQVFFEGVSTYISDQIGSVGSGRGDARQRDFWLGNWWVWQEYSRAEDQILHEEN